MPPSPNCGNRPLPSLPKWLKKRLNKVLLESHFEHSLYGPLNTFLTAYFPMEQQFLVKPQGLLRISVPDPSVDTESESDYESDESDSEAYEPEDDTQAASNAKDAGKFHDGNESGDSYGEKVRSDVGLKGSGMPDFIVAKAGMGKKPDVVLLIFEVKKDGVDRRHGRTRLCMYMYRASRKTRSPHLAGLLVCGEETEVFELNNKVLSRMKKQDISSWERQHTFKTADLDFNNYINNMAMFHWENAKED